MKNLQNGNLLFRKNMKKLKIFYFLISICVIGAGVFALYLELFPLYGSNRDLISILLSFFTIILGVFFLIHANQIRDLEMHENGFYHIKIPLKILFKQKSFFIPYENIEKIKVYNKKEPNWIEIYTKYDEFYYISFNALESNPPIPDRIKKDIAIIINIFQKYTNVEFVKEELGIVRGLKTAYQIMKRLK